MFVFLHLIYIEIIHLVYIYNKKFTIFLTAFFICDKLNISFNNTFYFNVYLSMLEGETNERRLGQQRDI